MKLPLVCLSLILLLLNSCAFHSGTTSSNVTYNGNNAEMVDIVSAQNSATRILGIGGLNKNALVLEAKRKMYQQNPLKKGQVYANIGVDVKQALYLLVDVTTVTVSADILQFYSDTVDHQVFSKLSNQTTSYDKGLVYNTSPSFTKGQSIYFLNKKEVQVGNVQSILGDLLKITTLEEEPSYIDKTECFHKIVFSDSSMLEKVSFRSEETTLQGHIVGYNGKSFVIKHMEQLFVVKKTLVTR